MSLESFYGGKQGISPVIKASFEYIDINDNAYQAALNSGTSAADLLPKTMDLCFLDADYENVWYNELCIIDTTNKNNPNNGKLFRRTLKGSGDTGINLCAEYIGRIVGPAGTSPFFSFGNLDSVNDQGTTDKINLSPAMQVSYPVDDEGNISSDKMRDGVQFNIEPTIQNASINNSMLVPGKYTNEDSEDEFHDNIRYTWLNVVDDSTDRSTQSIIYMGFEIPYPVLEFDYSTANWWNNVEINKQDTVEHPFYHKWDITIPRGVQGNAATNIRLAQQKEFSNGGGTEDKPFLYNFSDFINNGYGVYNLRNLDDENDHYGPDLDTASEGVSESYIWVYDYIFYDVNGYNDESTDEQEISKTYTFYLGKYNEISNVELENDGTLTFKYSNTDENTFERKISWIKNINISPDGLLQFTWNQEDYRPTNDSFPIENKTYYIKDENGNYVAESSIQEFSANTEYFEITNIYSKSLPYPTEIDINAQGEISISLSGRQDKLIVQDSAADSSQSYKLNYVNALSMNNDTKVLSYNTSTGQNNLLNNGKGINYIEAVKTNNDHHLLIYYSSTQYRITNTDINNGNKNGMQIIANGDGSYTWNGKIFRPDSESINNESITYWQDLGIIKGSATAKISTEIDYSILNRDSEIENLSIEDFLEQILNVAEWTDAEEQPVINPYYGGNIPEQGDWSSEDLAGTLIFAPNIGTGSFFFYDYVAEAWKFAGSLSESDSVDAQILLNTGDPLNNKNFLNDGVRFIERSASNSSDLPSNLLPNF